MTIFLSSVLVLLLSVTVQAATLTLLWEPVTTNTDGSAGVPRHRGQIPTARAGWGAGRVALMRDSRGSKAALYRVS
jgi:hypothetical protein